MEKKLRKTAGCKRLLALFLYSLVDKGEQVMEAHSVSKLSYHLYLSFVQ